MSSESLPDALPTAAGITHSSSELSKKEIHHRNSATHNRTSSNVPSIDEGHGGDLEMMAAIPGITRTSSIDPMQPSTRRPSLKQQSTTNNDSDRRESGTKGDSSSKSEKFKRIDKLRWVAWSLLIASQVAYWIMIAVQLSSLKRFFDDMSQKSAIESARLMKFSYERNLKAISESFSDFIKDEDVQTLASGNNASFDNVVDKLMDLAGACDVDIAVLVKTNLKVVASPNADLIGSRFDPQGIVSSTLSFVADSSQLQVISDISLNEFQEWVIKSDRGELNGWTLQARQRLNDKDIPFGMIFYSVKPIVINGTVVAALISGDIKTGDLDVIEDSFQDTHPGLEEAYVRARDGNMYVAAHTIITDDLFVDFTATLNPNFVKEIADIVLEDSWDEFSPYATTYTHDDGTEYAIAAMKSTSPRRGENVQANGKAQGLYIRGVSMSESTNYRYWMVVWTIALSGGFMIFDVLRTIAALRTLIDPLERLVMYIRLKKFEKYNQYLELIANSPRRVWLLVLFGLFSLSFITAMVPINFNALKDWIYGSSSFGSEMEGLRRGFSMKMYHMSIDTYLVSQSPDIRAIITGDTSTYNDVVQILQDKIGENRIEFATLVSSNGTILAGGNKDRRGQKFDPSQLATLTMYWQQPIVAVTTLSFDEFLAEGAPRWIDSELSSSTQQVSSLHAYETNKTVLVRFSTYPVYRTQASETPEGVLIFGDVVNGKAGQSDIVFQAYDSGYAGCFLFDNVTGSFQTLASVHVPHGSMNAKYDVSVNLDGFLKEAKEHGHQRTSIGKVDGELMKLTTVRFDASYRLQEGGGWILLPEFNVPVFLVRGVPEGNWKSIMQKQLAVSISALVLIFLVQVVVTSVLFHPVRKFIGYMNTQVGSLEQKKSPSKRKFKKPFRKMSRSRGDDSSYKSTFVPGGPTASSMSPKAE